jgi:hypothetical protein
MYIGNFNHAGWTLSRTNVYFMPLACLPPNTTLMFVTDGIKDLMDVEELSRFAVSIRNGVIPPDYQNTTRRRWRGRDPAAELDRFLAPRREYIPQPQLRAYRTRLLELLRRDAKRPANTLPQLSDVCKAIILSALVRHATDDLTVLAVRLPGSGSADAAMRYIRNRPHSWQEYRANMNSRPASVVSASSYGGYSAYHHMNDTDRIDRSPADVLRRRQRDSAPFDLSRGTQANSPSGDESDVGTDGGYDMDAYRSQSGSPPSPYLGGQSAPGSPASFMAATPSAPASPVPTPAMHAETARRLEAVRRSGTVRPQSFAAYQAARHIYASEGIDADGYHSDDPHSSGQFGDHRQSKRASGIFKTPSLRTLRKLFRKTRDYEGATTGMDGVSFSSTPLRPA